MRAQASLVLLLAATWATSAVAATSFAFRSPNGWENLLSGNISEQTAKQITPDFVEQIRGQRYAFYAINPEQGVSETMSVVLRSPPDDVTSDVLRELASTLRTNISKMLAADVLITEEKVAPLRGVACGRIMYRYSRRGEPIRSVTYVLPGEREMAIVSYSAQEAVFERDLPLFEASVATTEGLIEPSWLPTWLVGLLGGSRGRRDGRLGPSAPPARHVRLANLSSDGDARFRAGAAWPDEPLESVRLRFG